MVEQRRAAIDTVKKDDWSIMRSPYMTDPAQLESLQGQQYVVLRPNADVADFYSAERAKILAGTSHDVTYPHTGHVTLRGFYEPERVEELRDSIEAWARDAPPIELHVEAVDGFPPPFQVVIARLARTDSLVGAYARLTGLLDATDFRRIGELAVEDWIFHLSLVYARNLDTQQWDELLRAYEHDEPHGPRELAHDVDFVWYDSDGEHVRSISLRGGRYGAG